MCEFTFHCTKEVVSSSLSEMFGDETGKAGKLEWCVGLTNHTEQATCSLFSEVFCVGPGACSRKCSVSKLGTRRLPESGVVLTKRSLFKLRLFNRPITANVRELTPLTTPRTAAMSADYLNDEYHNRSCWWRSEGSNNISLALERVKESGNGEKSGNSEENGNGEKGGNSEESGNGEKGGKRKRRGKRKQPGNTIICNFSFCDETRNNKATGIGVSLPKRSNFKQ